MPKRILEARFLFLQDGFPVPEVDPGRREICQTVVSELVIVVVFGELRRLR